MAVTKAQTRIGSTRLTKRFKRKRLASPKAFKKGSFRTMKLRGGKRLIIGRKKGTTKTSAQALLTPRKRKK